MSGIAGLLEMGRRGLSDAPGMRRRLDTMLGSMATRCRDGSVIDIAPGLALAHINSVANTASLYREGSLTAIFDGRLDGRAALAAALSLDQGAHRVSDTELVVRAWRRWGEDCAARLFGDFCFAIWDGDQRTLFLARDHFGVRPLAYYLSPTMFAFATDPRALAALGYGAGIDDERIADALAGLPPPVDRTSYRDILMLPPGHCCTVTPDRCAVRPYYDLAIPEIRPRADAAEQFASIFDDAVGDRMSAPVEVGSLLSGGLDSSSITCVAARRRAAEGKSPLRTYSLVHDRTPEHSERSFIEAVLRSAPCTPTFVPGDDIALFTHFDAILDAQGGPFVAPNIASMHAMHAVAKKDGIRVLLDGHGGDETISYGFGRLTELGHGHRWIALAAELRAMGAGGQIPPMATFLALLIRFTLPRQLRGRVGRLLPGAAKQAQPATDAYLDRDFADRTAVSLRHAPPPPSPRNFEERSQHHRLLIGAAQPYAFQVLDGLATSSGVTLRFPFWDKRVVEFCLSLESSEKLRSGWSRSILRRAMDGILPTEVQWRRDKLDFSPHVIRPMIGVERELIETVLADRGNLLGAYANLPMLRAAYERICRDPGQANGYDVQAIWGAVALGLWLGQASGRERAATH